MRRRGSAKGGWWRRRGRGGARERWRGEEGDEPGGRMAQIRTRKVDV